MGGPLTYLQLCKSDSAIWKDKIINMTNYTLTAIECSSSLTKSCQHKRFFLSFRLLSATGNIRQWTRSCESFFLSLPLPYQRYIFRILMHSYFVIFHRPQTRDGRWPSTACICCKWISANIPAQNPQQGVNSKLSREVQRKIILSLHIFRDQLCFENSRGKMQFWNLII